MSLLLRPAHLLLVVAPLDRLVALDVDALCVWVLDVLKGERVTCWSRYMV